LDQTPTLNELVGNMSESTELDQGVYDEVEIEDMEFDEERKVYTYPCPCGDKFVISEEDMLNGEEIARCPSCSLYIRVIYAVEEEG